MLDLMFGTYNQGHSNVTGKEWLTKDLEIQKKYIEDKYCTFPFTISAIIDLINLVLKSNSTNWYNEVKGELPIYIVSGSYDPVGEYGKGPTEVFNKLVKTHHLDVSLRLWGNDRHEVLNELDKEQVKQEIFSWIESRNN